MIRRLALALLICLALLVQPGRVALAQCGTGGGTTSNSVASSGDFGALGSSSGVAYEASQQFVVAAGVLSEITFRLEANSGSPTGTLDWTISENSGGSPGATLQSGTISPTANAVNTITVGSGVSLSAATVYIFWLKPTNSQSSPNYWVWRRGSNTYADGAAADRVGGTWTQQGTKDLDFSVTTAPFPCTDTPTPTPTYTPSNTPTDTPTATPTDTETPGPSPTGPTPTPTDTPTATNTPTDTPVPSLTPIPSNTPLVTNTPDLRAVGTLQNGRAFAVDFTVSGGEAAIVSLLFLQVGLLFFLVILTLRRRSGTS